jgi:hypothetical protein
MVLNTDPKQDDSLKLEAIKHLKVHMHVWLTQEYWKAAWQSSLARHPLALV